MPARRRATLRRLVPWRVVLRRPGQGVAVMALLAILALAALVDLRTGAVRLVVDPSIAALLPSSGTDLARLQAARERFASDDLLFVTASGDDLFTPTGLARLRTLARTLAALPGIAHVESLATALATRVYADYSEVEAYLAELPDTIAAARAVRDEARANPLYSGYLLAADGDAATIAVRFDHALTSREQIALVGAIERAATAAGTDYFLSGPLYVRLEISRLLLVDLYRVMPAAVVVTLLVAALALRTWRGVMLPFAANALALAVTLALFVRTGGTLNYVTVMLPPTLYVVGLAYAIHVVTAYERQSGRRPGHLATVRAAVGEVALPVGLTACTTAVGFAALALSPIAAIADFGRWAAGGVLLAWFAALTVVPLGLLLCVRPGPGRRSRSARWLVAHLAQVAERHTRWLLAAGAALVLVSLIGASQVRVGTDYLANFADDNRVRQDFERMNALFAGAVPLQVVVAARGADAFKDPVVLRALAELVDWLAAQPEVGGVYSLLDYLVELERVLAPELVDDDPVPASRDLVSHLLLLGATEDVRRFADPAFATTLIQVRARAVESRALNALTARIDARLATLPAGLSGHVTGSSVLIARTLDDVVHGQVASLLAALVPIACVLLALFRSLRLALLALVPNALPILGFFGLLGYSGVSLNLTTSLVASAVLGIAVDDTIHFLVRLRVAAARLGEAAALREALVTVLRPVTLTTAALALGFLTLLGGELRSQADFGVLAAMTLLLAWLLDLGLTPALAVAGGFARTRAPLRDRDAA